MGTFFRALAAHLLAKYYPHLADDYETRYVEWVETVAVDSDAALAVEEALALTTRLPIVTCFGAPAWILATEEDTYSKVLKVTLRSVVEARQPQTYDQGPPAPFLAGPKEES